MEYDVMGNTYFLLGVNPQILLECPKDKNGLEMCASAFLERIVQVNSFEEYFDEFQIIRSQLETIASHMCEELTEGFFLEHFIAGLEDECKSFVKQLEPSSVYWAGVYLKHSNSWETQVTEDYQEQEDGAEYEQSPMKEQPTMGHTNCSIKVPGEILEGLLQSALTKEDVVVKNLSYLSLVSKVCTGLKIHLGFGNIVSVKLIMEEMVCKCKTVDEFDAKFKENGAEYVMKYWDRDKDRRKHAVGSLKHFQNQNPTCFLLSLIEKLANDEKHVSSSKLACFILKSAFEVKEQHRMLKLVQRWLSLDGVARKNIGTCLLQSLSSHVPDALSTASQVIAQVASIKPRQKQWPARIAVMQGMNATEEENHDQDQDEGVWALALIGGTLISSTSGLAARAIAISFGAITLALGTISRMIGASNYAVVTSAAVESVAVTTSFESTGAGLMGIKMATRTRSVFKFKLKFMEKNKQHGQLTVKDLISMFVSEYRVILWDPEKNLNTFEKKQLKLAKSLNSGMIDMELIQKLTRTNSVVQRLLMYQSTRSFYGNEIRMLMEISLKRELEWDPVESETVLVLKLSGPNGFNISRVHYNIIDCRNWEPVMILAEHGTAKIARMEGNSSSNDPNGDDYYISTCVKYMLVAGKMWAFGIQHDKHIEEGDIIEGNWRGQMGAPAEEHEKIEKSGVKFLSATDEYERIELIAKIEHTTILFTNCSMNVPAKMTPAKMIGKLLQSVMVMTHGCAKGLLIPPKVAAALAIVVPVPYKNASTRAISDDCSATVKTLGESYTGADVDVGDNFSPEWGYSDYEIKAVPVGIKSGSKDLANTQVCAVRRFHSAKVIHMANVVEQVDEMLTTINQSLFDAPQVHNDSSLYHAKSDVMCCSRISKLPKGVG